MSEEKINRYLVQIRYASDMCDRARIASSTPDIKAILERTSNGDCKLAWTSSDGVSFGFFLRTSKSSRWIYDELMSPGQHGDPFLKPFHVRERDTSPGQASPMRTGDSILVLEIGEDFYGNGFSNCWSWLQKTQANS